VRGSFCRSGRARKKGFLFNSLRQESATPRNDSRLRTAEQILVGRSRKDEIDRRAFEALRSAVGPRGGIRPASAIRHEPWRRFSRDLRDRDAHARFCPKFIPFSVVGSMDKAIHQKNWSGELERKHSWSLALIAFRSLRSEGCLFVAPDVSTESRSARFMNFGGRENRRRFPNNSPREMMASFFFPFARCLEH